MDIDLSITNPSISMHSTTPDAWPFELFLYFVRFLDVLDLLSLRLVSRKFNLISTNRLTWRSVAEELVKDRPLPISLPISLHALVTGNSPIAYDESIMIFARIKSCVTAARVQRNWTEIPQPKLRKMLMFNRGVAKNDDDVSALLTPGSRYLVCADYYEEEKQKRLTIWDIHLQVLLGSWAFPKQSCILTFRSVENGAAIMFFLHPGTTRPEGLVEYELLRFEFSQNPNKIEGQFMSHSIFRQPRQLNDISLSEDLILITDVHDTSASTVIFEVFNWRTGAHGRVRTSIAFPPDPFNLNITGSTLALWVQSRATPRLYNIPMELLDHCLRDDVDEVHAPDITPLPLTFDDVMQGLNQLELLQSFRGRHWETTKNDRINDRPWIVSQLFRAPTNEAAEDDPNSVTLILGQYRLPVPFQGPPTLRTCILGPTRVHLSALFPREARYPLFELGTKHACWVETVPETQEKVIKCVTFPGHYDVAEQMMDTEWFRQHRTRQFPIPSSLDLGNLMQMRLDEPSGILCLTMTDGKFWLLYFDGYDDDQYNISEATLRDMFSEHQGTSTMGLIDIDVGHEEGKEEMIL